MQRNRSDFDSAMRRFESSRPGHITQGPFSIELPRNRPHAWDDRSTLTVWLTAYPHHSMPYLILSGQQVRDVSAYILSLRDESVAGWWRRPSACVRRFGLP